MGVKVPTRCLHLLQPSVPHSPSSPQTLASSISSASSSLSKRRALCSDNGVLVCRYVQWLHQSGFAGFRYHKLCRTGSLQNSRGRGQGIKTACSAGFGSFSDEEFNGKISELAMNLQLSSIHDDNLSENNEFSNQEQEQLAKEPCTRESFRGFYDYRDAKYLENPRRYECFEPPAWPERDEINLVYIERKVNSLGIPLSLRMIQRKKQWQKGVKAAKDSACSVRKAFSSMVFIIRELHSYTLQMREMLFYEDLQGILGWVQKEMLASFVWLFQQVFSHTPTLMVSLMILLANYSVYSMANSTSIVSSIPLQAYAATTESVSMIDDQSHEKEKFDSSKMGSFSVSALGGKTTPIGGGGGGGGGGKFRPVASSTDGEGSYDKVSSYCHGTIIPDGASSVINPSTTNGKESISGQVTKEEELRLWNSIVEEVSKMQAVLRGEALDPETVQRFVSPVQVKIDVDDYEDYGRTGSLYQIGLAHDPNNPLLLTNYAQFLYLVIQDYDGAEEYFKRAVKVEPKDAEALHKYANFLWMVKKDLWAAERTYLEAINADPGNSYYAANYANFLWNTGGEDTCFPA